MKGSPVPGKVRGFVCDRGAHGTFDGGLIAEWEGGSSGRFGRPVGVAFDSADNVYVANQARKMVMAFAPPALD